ncbi:MAG: GNAT family N-acetyltransferase [Spirochaetes bacterium]|nr:GNAT family N-acetyltransferase [Spirochaetota bacterium]
MVIKVYNSITEINRSEWDKIVKTNHIICTHKFLEAVEKSNINDCKYFYPVVYENDKIVAHTCAYYINMELDVFVEGLIKKMINKIRKYWKNFLILKLTECGTPIALGNTISITENIDRKQAFSLIINEIEKMARKAKRGILLIRDFYDEDINFFDYLTVKKYKRVNNLPNTILKVPWKSFEEYLANLRSKYRSTIIRRMNIAAKRGLSIEIIDDFASLSDELLSLWFNTYEKAKEYRREILTNDFFINISNYLEEKSKMILLKHKNKIVAFGLVSLDTDVLHCMFLGLDYKYNNRLYIYNNSFYSAIKLAIAEGKKEIDLGMTSYTSKLEIGAELINAYMYIKHINPVLNPIITNIFGLMNPKKKLPKTKIYRDLNKINIDSHREKAYSSS